MGIVDREEERRKYLEEHHPEVIRFSSFLKHLYLFLALQLLLLLFLETLG